MHVQYKKRVKVLTLIIILMMVFFPFLGMIESQVRYLFIKSNMMTILKGAEDTQVSALNQLIDNQSIDAYIYKNTKNRVLVSTVEATSVANAYDSIKGDQLALKRIFEVNTADNMYTVFVAIYYRSMIWLYMLYGTIVLVLIISLIRMVNKHKVILPIKESVCSTPTFYFIDKALSIKYLTYLDLTIDDIQKIMKYLHQPFSKDDVIRFVDFADFKLVHVKQQVHELDSLIQDEEEEKEVDINQLCLILLTSFKASQSQAPKYRLYAQSQNTLVLNYSMIQRLCFALVYFNQFKVRPTNQCDLEIKVEQDCLQFFVKSRKLLDDYHELDWIEDVMITGSRSEIISHELNEIVQALYDLKMYFNAICTCKNHFGVIELSFIIPLSNMTRKSN